MKKISRATVRPKRSLNLLSHREIQGVMETNEEIFQIFRLCALAVLNTGSEEDDVEEVFERYKDFEVDVISESRGIKLEVRNAPASAFVDGQMIHGIRDHLFSVLRDVVYTEHKITRDKRFDLSNSEGLTDSVFRILRNAGVVQANRAPNLVVCWGGHSIDRVEYDYSKEVGYELGLRGLDVATGCGIGAMKGPMKGALIGHAKQQIRNGRYVGITEPGIIASESPNPTVNELVILPDIEKRLEAFVRLAHCIIVFPGGAGTAEEVLYLLGILIHPNNGEIPLPVIFAAPEGREAYFEQLDSFIQTTLGKEAANYYEIITGDPARVARVAKAGIEKVVRYRRRVQESYAYNWNTFIPEDFQQPFHPTHENMANLQLDLKLSKHELAAELRRAFSGIVAGNVKSFGVQQIHEHGPYKITADPSLIGALSDMLDSFVKQGRMKLNSDDYEPCFEIVK
ncbi:MAG: nucleotide 5'-monophosphate nucleosidase PpnN [Cellvibrionaceae bacterium]